MKNSQVLSIAVGAVLAATSASAFALGTAPAAGNSLDIGGATATDRTQVEAFLDAVAGVCQNNDPNNATISADVYASGTSWSPASPGTYRIDCNVRSGTLTGQAISVAKFAGGSETGVTTVANGVATIGTNTVVTPNRTGCTGGPTVVPATADLIGYRLFTGCPTTATIPQVGVSDVEPKLFGLSATTISRLVSEGAAAIPFGVVVSRNFYAALQAAQGLTGCLDTVGGAGDDTEACMPNLTKAQVRGLLSQQIFDTTSLKNGGVDIAAPSSGDTVIRICKRADTSGTEQSHELLWFSEGCIDASSPQAQIKLADSVNAGGNQGGLVWNQTLGAGNFDANLVFPGRGSGDTESCIDWADDNGLYAIGINSGDRSPNDASLEFRYVKVDGWAPSVNNVQAQRYFYYTENTVLRPTASSPNFAAYNTGVRPTIFSNYLLASLRNATVLARGHALRDWGRAGLLVRPVAGVAVAALPLNPAVPINTTTRQLSIDPGTPVDNCFEPVAVGTLPVIVDP